MILFLINLVSSLIRTPKGYAKLSDCNENNLKNISLNIPLQCLVVVTGVSGSGKSTLVKNILYPAIAKRLDKKFDELGSFGSIGGDLDKIKDIEIIDQNPIGRSSRSNPATYSKAYDNIRKVLAQ